MGDGILCLCLGVELFASFVGLNPRHWIESYCRESSTCLLANGVTMKLKFLRFFIYLGIWDWIPFDSHTFAKHFFQVGVRFLN